MGAASLALLANAGFPVLLGTARAGESPLFPDDRIMGQADAPITIIEYSSLTCPHCAKFHADTLPKIKESWIAKGKARLVYRHFPLDGPALRAALVADCLKGDRYFAFLDLLFKSQKRWAKSKDPVKSLSQLAKLAGMNDETFQACISNEAEMNRILERLQDAKRTYGVTSTPTLIVNGRKVEGAQGYKQLEAIFEKIISDS
jgi:protein-disulfide isomerase